MAGPVLLIDALNVFLRNYVRSPYMDANGARAGGTTGMIASVRKLISDFRASNALVVWDGEGGSQRRKAIYSNYKEGRSVRLNKREDDMAETPEEQLANLRLQVEHAKEYLSLLGIPQVRCDGVEADDLMAYVAANMNFVGGCVIVTTDQDLLQLIREKGPLHEADCELTTDNPAAQCSCVSPMCEVSEVRVWSPIKKVLYNRERFISDYGGVLPENWRLVKALTGDNSDNIEGVKGFGAKTVLKSFPFLTERRATADEVMAAAVGLKGVVGKRLVESESRFRENLVLMDLSEPMLSATAARQARVALRSEVGCREVEFRVRCVRDGVGFTGDNFVGPFREMTLRRRHALGELQANEGEQE